MLARTKVISSTTTQDCSSQYEISLVTILDVACDTDDMIDQRTRLYITPFSQSLLSAVLPSNAAHLAENISYHIPQTFPENNYGFLELPSMEAEKLKKKLNGSILRGKKIRIEEARPRKRALEDHQDGTQVEHTDAFVDERKRSKRTKRDPATISGHELSPGRKIKRGWTEPKKAKGRKSTKDTTDQASSKYTDKQELLFRTKHPPNKAKAPTSHSTKDKKNSRDVLVHEFEKSTVQPSFLREDNTSDIKRAVDYIDGKGWVDEDGEVVEEESSTVGKRRKRPAVKDSEYAELVQDGSSKPKKQVRARAEKSLLHAEAPPLYDQAEPDDETSSAGSSSDSEASVTASSSQPNASKATSIGETEADKTPTPSVHPLEAIFKRPTKAASADIAKPSLELQTSFSFFEAEAEAATIVPDTPFNSQELHSRELRSAAPTPDTAAPSRLNSWGSQSRNVVDSEDEEDEEEESAAQAGEEATPSRTASSAKKGHHESEFAKFFWESRGDNNRAWKRRAREAKKEKRQRENRQRGRRL